MTRRSRAAAPSTNPRDAERGLPGNEQHRGNDAESPAAAGEGAEAAFPPWGVPRRPAIMLFRWEQQAGPRDVWDAFPFPQAGSGVFNRLHDAASSSRLFAHGRGGNVLALSAELNVGGVLPLRDDEDVEKALRLWQPSPGNVGVIAIVVRGASASPAVHRCIGAVGLGEPPLLAPLLHGGGGDGGPRAARLAPAAAAALGNALPVELWACILNAAASSRCGADAVAFPFLALLAAALSLPLASSSTLRLFVRYCAFLFMPTARRLIHPPR